MGLEIFQSLLQQSSAQGSRTTALQPVIWISSLVMASMVTSISVHAPQWVLVFLGCIMTVLLATFVFAYVYFALRNPDALRSERFTLTKMQIEKNQLGDTVHGFMDVAVKAKALPPAPETER